MNTTKQDSLVVVSMACRNRSSDSRRRATAIRMAPTAPMAPPSVGVATPMKMVPSTRKISASGGIITKVTRSARADSSPSPNALLTSAMTKAVAPQNSSATMRSSNGAVLFSTQRPRKYADTAEIAISTSNERPPRPPFGAWKRRASFGQRRRRVRRAGS